MSESIVDMLTNAVLEFEIRDEDNKGRKIINPKLCIRINSSPWFTVDEIISTSKKMEKYAEEKRG